MSTFETLSVETSGAVAIVRVNRPQVMNALNAKALDEIRVAFESIDGDAAIGAAILTGAEGSKRPAFVAGADIAEMSKMNGYLLRDHSRRGQRAFDAIERCSKPVIAAINGFALGGGLELAMSCHIRFAAKSAMMGQPEINLGIIPGFGGTQRLPRLVGRGRALEILLSGEMIGAEEAERIGLVDHVTEPDALLERSKKLAEQLAAKAPLARALIIDAVVRGQDMTFDDAQRIEADLFGVAGATADVREGLGAFLEKRSPKFRGE